MPSSYSASLRLTLQFAGEGINTWGDIANTGVFQLVDFAISGWTTKALSGDYTLTTANGMADEARSAMLKFTGGAGPFTVTIPAVSKAYDIWNACSGQVIVTTGSGTTATIQPGEVPRVICDGANVKRVVASDFAGQRLTSVADPTGVQDAATKNYVDNTAFNMAAGALPGQVGNDGKFLKTNVGAASWQSILNTDIVGLSANAAAVRAGSSVAQALTPGDTYAAFAVVTVTYAASVALDFGSFVNAAITLTGNLTLANPTNHKVGQEGVVALSQDGTGSRLLSAVGSFWKRAGGVPLLSTTASVTDYLVFKVISSTVILYDLIRNPT